MFMKPSYGMVVFLSNVKSQSSHFGSFNFNSFTCFKAACRPIVVIIGNGSRQCQINIYDVFTNMKTETRRRMARERRGAGSSVVSMETPYYKTIY